MERCVAYVVDCVDMGIRVEQHLDAAQFFTLAGKMKQALTFGRLEVRLSTSGNQKLKDVFGRRDVAGDGQRDGAHLGLVADRRVGACLQQICRDLFVEARLSDERFVEGCLALPVSQVHIDARCFQEIANDFYGAPVDCEVKRRVSGQLIGRIDVNASLKKERRKASEAREKEEKETRRSQEKEEKRKRLKTKSDEVKEEGENKPSSVKLEHRIISVSERP